MLDLELFLQTYASISWFSTRDVAVAVLLVFILKPQEPEQLRTSC